MVEEEFNVKLNMDMTEATVQLTKWITVLRSALRLARKMGLPDEYTEAIIAIQKMISTLYMLKAALDAVRLSRALAGDPLAIATLGIDLAGFGLTVADLANTS